MSFRSPRKLRHDSHSSAEKKKSEQAKQKTVDEGYSKKQIKHNIRKRMAQISTIINEMHGITSTQESIFDEGKPAKPPLEAQKTDRSDQEQFDDEDYETIIQ